MRIEFVNSSGSKVTGRALVHLIASDFSFLHAVGRQTAGQKRHSLTFTIFFPIGCHMCVIYMTVHLHTGSRFFYLTFN